MSGNHISASFVTQQEPQGSGVSTSTKAASQETCALWVLSRVFPGSPSHLDPHCLPVRPPPHIPAPSRAHSAALVSKHKQVQLKSLCDKMPKEGGVFALLHLPRHARVAGCQQLTGCIVAPPDFPWS